MKLPSADFLDCMPGLIAAYDASGRIAFWSHRLEEVTGFTRTEMLGKPREALLRGRGLHPLPVKAGGNRLVRWEMGPLEVPEGVWTCSMGIDVTAYQGDLAGKVVSQRLTAIGRLASGLAHEVRNPINSALLQLAVLRRRLDTETNGIRPIADAVEQELARLDRLVGDFIAFAQPHILAIRPIDVAAVCQAVAAVISAEAEPLRVRLDLDLAPGLPSVPADADRLQQVLLNLSRNALEAMTDGGALTLRARHESPFLELEVCDTGPGFPDGAPVFDPFFTTKANGTGLGLSIVHRIVSDHGGSVRAHSKPGETCFTVALPAGARASG
jgi:signal transduction histidine kinase